MPQLMPLYWMFSIFMCIFFLILLIKINGNYINKDNYMNKVMFNSNSSKMWYW